jgi:hypothetical protein
MIGALAGAARSSPPPPQPEVDAHAVALRWAADDEGDDAARGARGPPPPRVPPHVAAASDLLWGIGAHGADSARWHERLGTRGSRGGTARGGAALAARWGLAAPAIGSGSSGVGGAGGAGGAGSASDVGGAGGEAVGAVDAGGAGGSAEPALPPGWKVVESRRHPGRHYFHNDATGATTWVRPA